MGTKHTLKFIAATASLAGVLALAGCLNGADQKSEAQSAHERKVTFIAQTSEAAVQAAGIPSNAEISANLEKIGCPKLAQLFSDFSTYQGSQSKPFPPSFIEHLSCFGINGNGTIEDIDSVTAKFQNPTQLLDCMCGGSALSDLLKGNVQAWSAFDGSVKAAASSFDGSTKAASGSFDGSSKGSTGGFDGSSKGTTGSFGD